MTCHFNMNPSEYQQELQYRVEERLALLGYYTKTEPKEVRDQVVKDVIEDIARIQ